MNEHAKLWVEKLRSGEYEQGHGCLRRDNQFCCLGVASDIFHKATGQGGWMPTRKPTWNSPEGQLYVFEVDDDHQDATMPKAVANWFGVTTGGGRFGSTDDTLWKRNDRIPYAASPEERRSSTLSEIADLIESEPEGLFVTEST